MKERPESHPRFLWGLDTDFCSKYQYAAVDLRPSRELLGPTTNYHNPRNAITAATTEI